MHSYLCNGTLQGGQGKAMNSTKSLGLLLIVMFGCAKKANIQNHCLQIGKIQCLRKSLLIQSLLNKMKCPYLLSLWILIHQGENKDQGLFNLHISDTLTAAT